MLSIHDDTIHPDEPTVTAARGQRIAAVDLIITCRNAPTIEVWQAADRDAAAADPVRNGDRWRVAAIHPTTGRVAAERLTDAARTVFGADYVRDHITHGYATTVHSAQGVTADSTHAVLGETITRSMLYVAMTRARDANTAYLYERATELEYGPTPVDAPHVIQRGTSDQAAVLARAIIDTRDDIPVTAHQVAANTPRHLLPDRVARPVDRRSAAVDSRRIAFSEWLKAADGWATMMAHAHTRERARTISRDRTRDRDSGIEL